MQLMFAEQINAPIVEHIHQSKSPNESQALLSPKDLIADYIHSMNWIRFVIQQANPNGFGFFRSPFGSPPSLFSPNKKKGGNSQSI